MAFALRPRYPEPMTLPVLIVGDVQGDHERLTVALAAFPEDEVETVFLGASSPVAGRATQVASRRPGSPWSGATAGPSWATTTCS